MKNDDQYWLSFDFKIGRSFYIYINQGIERIAVRYSWKRDEIMRYGLMADLFV
jgi:hypothetical protein